MTHKIEKIE